MNKPSADGSGGGLKEVDDSDDEDMDVSKFGS